MSATGSLIGTVLAAIGASLCCLFPMMLVSLGITGTWMSQLQRFEPIRPAFVALAFLSLGWAFWHLYVRSRRCAVGPVCASPKALKRQRLIFWLVLIPVLALLAFPWYAFLFY